MQGRHGPEDRSAPCAAAPTAMRPLLPKPCLRAEPRCAADGFVPSSDEVGFVPPNAILVEAYFYCSFREHRVPCRNAAAASRCAQGNGFSRAELPPFSQHGPTRRCRALQSKGIVEEVPDLLAKVSATVVEDDDAGGDEFHATSEYPANLDLFGNGTE